MKKIIDYLFYRYYLISIKNEEFPRFGAICVLAEVVTMVYLFAALILSFLFTGDFFLPNTSGRARIIIGIIGSFIPWIYSDKAVLSLCYIVPTVGLILMLFLYQFG